MVAVRCHIHLLVTAKAKANPVWHPNNPRELRSLSLKYSSPSRWENKQARERGLPLVIFRFRACCHGCGLAKTVQVVVGVATRLKPVGMFDGDNM